MKGKGLMDIGLLCCILGVLCILGACFISDSMEEDIKNMDTNKIEEKGDTINLLLKGGLILELLGLLLIIVGLSVVDLWIEQKEKEIKDEIVKIRKDIWNIKKKNSKNNNNERTKQLGLIITKEEKDNCRRTKPNKEDHDG